MRKRLLEILLCLIMMVLLLPGTAQAETRVVKVQRYWIAGLEVNVENTETGNYAYGKDTTCTATNATELPVDGWTWAIQVDHTSGQYTIFLNGYNGGLVGPSSVVYDEGNGGGLTIDLNGSNTITCADGDGLRVDDGNTTIQGEGSLTIAASWSGSRSAYGIRAEDLTVNSGTITVTGTHDNSNGEGTSYGIKASTVTVNGGTVIATGNGSGVGYGITADTLTVNGGTVTANGITQAVDLSAAPVLGAGMIAKGSTYGDGWADEVFDYSEMSTYKWFSSYVTTPGSFESLGTNGICFRYNGNNVLTVTMPTTTGYYTYGTATGDNASEIVANVEKLPADGWNWAVQKHVADANGVEYTFIMNNFNITYKKSGMGDGLNDAFLYVKKMNLELRGTNTMTEQSGGGISSNISGIESMYVLGDGSLTVVGGSYGFHIDEWQNGLYITDGTVVFCPSFTVMFFGDLNINGGAFTVYADRAGVLGREPKLGLGVTARASVNEDGSAPVTYNSEEKSTYKWFQTSYTPHTHSGTPVAGQAADCTTDGWKDYYHCSGCGKYFSDEACTVEITDLDAWKVGEGKDASNGHSYSTEWSYDTDNHWYAATCGHDEVSGKEAHHDGTATCVAQAACADCGQSYGVLGTHSKSLVNGQAATETVDGWKDYYRCGVCHKYFTDAACADEITDLDAWKVGDGKIPATGQNNSHVCNPVIVNAVSATCTTAGKDAYYHCEDCGKNYADAQGINIISDLATWGNTAVLDHNFGTTWEKDEENHWYKCNNSGCTSVSSKAAHDYIWYITKDATENDKGEMTGNCAICGHTATKETPVVEETMGSGDVLVVSPESNANKAQITNTEEVKKSIPLTDAERSAVVGGMDLSIILETTDITATVGTDEKAELDSNLGEFKAGIYMDISLWKQVGAGQRNYVSKTVEKVKISFVIPENLRAGSDVTRAYKVLKLHNGVVTTVDTLYDAASYQLAFATDEFSTYLLSYQDTEKVPQPTSTPEPTNTPEPTSTPQPTNTPEPTTPPQEDEQDSEDDQVDMDQPIEDEKDESPKTGDTSKTSWWLLLMLLSGIGMLIAGVKWRTSLKKDN